MSESLKKYAPPERFKPRVVATITLDGNALGRNTIGGESPDKAELLEIAPDVYKVHVNGYLMNRASCPTYDLIVSRLHFERRKNEFLPRAEQNADPEARVRELRKRIQARHQKLMEASARESPPSREGEVLRAERQTISRKRRSRGGLSSPERYSRDVIIDAAEIIRESKKGVRRRLLCDAEIEEIIREAVRRREAARCNASPCVSDNIGSKE